MKLVLWGLVALLVGGVCQFGVAPYLAVLGNKPDFLLLMVVGAALRRGMLAGGWLGGAAGLWEDFFAGQCLGARALGMALAGMATGYARDKVFRDQPLVPVGAALGATALCELTSWAVWRAAGFPLPLGAGLARVTLPVCLYNALLAPFLLGWVWRREEVSAGAP